jgi:hypothetical protein
MYIFGIGQLGSMKGEVVVGRRMLDLVLLEVLAVGMLSCESMLVMSATSHLLILVLDILPVYYVVRQSGRKTDLVRMTRAESASWLVYHAQGCDEE